MRLTFTALNLEGTTQGTPTGRTPCGTTCNDPRGCDCKCSRSLCVFFRSLKNGCTDISIYDGGDANAPLLGTFSGNPTVGPSVSSSGQDLAIYFHTDSGNCGISSVEDPGMPHGDPLWLALPKGGHISADAPEGTEGIEEVD